MKKLVCILLAAMLLVMPGCGNDSEPVSTERDEVSAAASDTFSFDYTQYGYIQSEFTVPEGVEDPSRYYMYGDVFSFCTQSYDAETSRITYTVYCAKDGGDASAVTELTTEPDHYFGDLVYDGTQLWVTDSVTVPVENDPSMDFIIVETLQRRGSDGAVLAEYPISEQFQESDFYYIFSILPSLDGGLWVSAYVDFSGVLLYFSENLELKWSLDGFDDAPQIALTADGDAVCIHDNTLCRVDENGFDPTNVEIEGGAHQWTLVSGTGGYELFAYDDITLYTADTGSGTLIPLLNWAAWGMTGENTDLIGALSETELLTESWGILSPSRTVILSRVGIDEIPEKTTLTMGSISDVDQIVLEAVSAFNLENPEYNIQLVTYESETQLDMAIAGGNAPDIFALDQNQSKYTQKGLLADMLTLMEQYGGFSKEDFITSFLDASMTGDSLYMTALYFDVRTIVGLPEYVGTDQGWSLDQFITALENKPDDMYACDFGGTSMLEFLISGLYTNFVDIENGTCSFDSPEFIRLLDVLAKYTNFDYVDIPFDEEFGSILNNEQLLDVTNIWLADYIRNSDAYDLVTLVGYPGAEGNGADFNINTRYGIYSGSPHIAGAWQFMSFLLSDRVQSSQMTSILFPVTQSALESKFDETVQNYKSEFPEAQQQADKLMDYIGGVKTISYREYALYEIILEEAEALYGGSKTAEETAAIIQNRVSTYLAEMG